MSVDLTIVLGVPVLVFLIAFITQRITELFDKLVVLNMFPWWHAVPLPPPPNPSNPLEDLIRRQPGLIDKEPVAAAEGILTHPDTLLRFHLEYLQQLVYYIIKNGHFLLQHTLWQRLVEWVFNDETFNSPHSLIEDWLARREGVSLLPGDEKFARCLVNNEDSARIVLATLSMPENRPTPLAHEECGNIELSREELVVQLQVWANYCHVRNQRTYNAFSSITNKLYLLTGVVWGIFIFNLLLAILPEGFVQIAERPGGSQGSPWIGGSSGALGGEGIVGPSEPGTPSPGISGVARHVLSL